MASLPQIGLEATIAGMGAFQSAANSIQSTYNQLDKAASNVAKSTSSSFVSLGNGVIGFAQTAATVGVAGIAALTAGIVGLGVAAVGEFAKYERMSLSITNLVAREISQGQVIEQQIQTRISLTKKENEELAELPQRIKDEELSRNTLAAQIQEQKQRIIDLTAAYGDNGLNVQTAKNRLAEMENEYNKSGQEIGKLNSRIGELNNKSGQLTTTLQKVRTGQMSMSDAMAQAGPRASELLKWVQLLAIQSPFTQEGVANAFRTALAYGFTTEQAQRITGAMIDFTSATGKSEESANLIALALGQIQARGKLSAQELRQLSEQGVGVNKILEDMGFSLDDVTNGLVPVDKFIEATIKDMEVFKGAAKAQSTTFAGLIASMSDLKSIGLREFFTGTFNAIQPYAASFVGWLTDAALQTGQIKKLGESLGQYVGGAIKQISQFVAILGTGGLSAFNYYLGAEGIPLWYELQELLKNIGGVFSGLSGLISSNLSGPFTEFTTNIIPMITQGLTFINDHFEEFKGALLGIGVVLGAGVFAALIAGILALLTPINLIIAGAALLGAAWAGNWGGIQEKTFAVWAVMQPILQQIYDWLSINIPIAVQATTDFWSNTLYPTLLMVGNWITTTLIPTLTNVYNWLYTNIPVAITTLSDIWTNTLLPAITSVWNYLSTNVVPLLQSFNDFILAVFNLTIKAMAGLWQNIVLPALQKIWDVIAKNLQPVFTALSDFISTNITPKLDKLGNETFPMLTKALETVTRWIKEATGFFKSMADAVNNFQLPEVLQEHSPSPFAMSLIHIADAADKAGLSMQSLSNITQKGTYDKLFKIDRGITDFNRILQESRRGLEKWGKDRDIGAEKTTYAIKRFREIFKGNFKEIMGSANPLATFQDMLSHQVEWRKIGIKPELARGLGEKFFKNFFAESEKRAQMLMDMIVSGSGQALQIAGQLNQFASQQADYLQSQVDTLQEFINSGQTEMTFQGQIISAVQAQELLNRALADQRDIQDDILEIKQQESQLQFLEGQLNLIKMVREAGLNVQSVLGGITLGLNASVPDMIAATNNVIQAIIGQVNSDLGNISQVGQAIGDSLSQGVSGALGIASPSKVMKWIAKQTTSGFVDEMLAQAPRLVSAIQNTIVVPAGQLISGIGSNTSNVTNNNFNMTVSTLGSPQAVMQQYQVMRAMI